MNDWYLVVLSSIAIIILIGAHVLWRIRRGTFLMMDPLNMFWAGVIVCYVIQPMAYYEQLLEFQPTANIPGAMTWILAGLACVALGYESRIGTRISRLLPSGSMHLSCWRLRAFGLLLIFIGVVGYAYEVSTAGGLKAWLAAPRGGTDWEVASSYLASLSAILPLGVALILFSVEFRRDRAALRIFAWVAAFVMLMWFIYLGTRSRTILWVATMLSAYYLPKRSNPSLGIVLLLFPALLVGVNFLAENRTRFTDLSMNMSVDEAASQLEKAARDAMGFGEGGYRTDVQRGMEFNYVITAIELVPDAVPYTYGYNFLELLTRPIPRALWENKRYPAAEAFTPLLEAGGLSSTWVSTSIEPVLMGPAPTFAGFWWAVGGPLALLVGGFATGILLRTIRAIYDRHGGKNESDVIIYWSLLGIGFVEAVATPWSWMFSLPLVIIPLIIVVKLAGVRTPRARSVQDA